MSVRRTAVAGTWYPSGSDQLRAAIEDHLAHAATRSGASVPADAEIVALIAPHAGLAYSGPVAGHAYAHLASRSYDLIVLVGPSHFVAFDGAALWSRGAFDTPLGRLRIDEEAAAALASICSLAEDRPAAHAREHSIEMQLPFIAALAPDTPILPIVMGHQTRATAETLGDALAAVLAGRRALLIASSDLSHFHDAATAARLDARVIACVDALDPEGLMTLLEARADHACGGGPMVSVLRAAGRLGARGARVLDYADSGDVSGDKSSVVGYLAAAVWR